MAIVRSEKIRSGKPVVQGTRVTVEDIVERFYSLERSTETISSDLGVSVEEVEEALRYHRNNIEGEVGVEV